MRAARSSTRPSGYGGGASEELIGPAARRRGRRATRSCSRPRPASAPRTDGPRPRHLAARPAPRPRHLAGAPRHRPRRPLAGPRLVRHRSRRGDDGRARPRGVVRAGAVRRRVQLHRLAARPGGDLAARRPEPRAARLHPGGVLPAPPRRRARGPARAAAASGLGRAGRTPRWAGGVLTGKYRPGTPPTPAAPAGSPPVVERYLDEHGRAVVEAVARAADGLGLDAAAGRAGLGPRPAST